MPSHIRNSRVGIHDHLHGTTGLGIWLQYGRTACLSEHPSTFYLCSQGSVGLSQSQSGSVGRVIPFSTSEILLTTLALTSPPASTVGPKQEQMVQTCAITGTPVNAIFEGESARKRSVDVIYTYSRPAPKFSWAGWYRTRNLVPNCLGRTAKHHLSHLCNAISLRLRSIVLTIDLSIMKC